ncbi:MAG: hypothetical protein Q8P29_04105 [Candidatus Levybacteria bacterium]|nr:hypothetical protein [Candidatus Levybacteria bacterium]
MRILKLKDFLKLVGFLFVAKIIFGLFYLLLGWQANIAGWAVPTWLVLVGIVTDAILANIAFKLAKK